MEEKRGGFSSTGWTGVEEPPANPYGSSRPPQSPEMVAATMLAGLLGFGGFILHLGWRMLLSLHSPLRPSAATGHTEPLGGGRYSPTILYVQPIEVWVDLALLCSCFLMPGAYLGWRWLRRRRAQSMN